MSRRKFRESKHTGCRKGIPSFVCCEAYCHCQHHPEQAAQAQAQADQRVLDCSDPSTRRFDP